MLRIFSVTSRLRSRADSRELRRMLLPGTSVNRGNKKGRSSTPAHVPLSRLTSLRLGEALRLAREVHSDIYLLSHDPGVVPRANYVHVPRPYLLLGAVVVDEVHPTRTMYPVCSTWQLSVPTMGLTFSDQRHLGSRVNRPAVTSSKCTRSTLPLSKVLVSSGTRRSWPSGSRSRPW